MYRAGACKQIMDKGMALMGGGMVNKYSGRVAKNLGADIIIGVDVKDE